MLDMLDMLDWFGCYLIEFGCDWVLSTKGGALSCRGTVGGGNNEPVA